MAVPVVFLRVIIHMNTFIELFGIILPLLVLIVSIIAHEVAHGLAAYLHGDNTAYDQGRLTLNPIPHIDIVGSIIVPLISVVYTNYSIGWAKPVPYNPNNLKGKYAEAWVASAGVLTNFLIAALAVLVFKLLPLAGIATGGLTDLFFLIVWINVSLGVFNLIPVPPFDGMSIVQAFFPRVRMLTRGFRYNPLYMIGVIIVTSSLFSMFAPTLFVIVKALLL
jgi:Zn-dependent protease